VSEETLRHWMLADGLRSRIRRRKAHRNNLMCSNNATYCPDPVHLGKYLTDDHVLKGKKGLFNGNETGN
jgi:hypothetical protein